MSNLSYEDRLRNILGLIGRGSAEKEVLEKAKELKEQIRQDMTEAWKVVAILDSSIKIFAPEEPWQPGLWEEIPKRKRGIQRRYPRPKPETAIA